MNHTHVSSGVRGFVGTTGGSTYFAPGSRDWPVLAGKGGGGSAGDRRRCWKLSPGSEGFLMWPLVRTGGGGGGAFFFAEEELLTAVEGGGIV